MSKLAIHCKDFEPPSLSHGGRMAFDTFCTGIAPCAYAHADTHEDASQPVWPHNASHVSKHAAKDDQLH
eukprot:6188276-Pleurochrysis_carterae.AAC.2